MPRLAVAVLLLGLPALAGEPPAAPTAPKQAHKKPARKFTIGKETTYVTEPVDADGTIDYASALNKRLQKGVTPDSNANVLLWKALGPRPEGATMPAEYFKWLGIEAPPERGDYFIPLTRYAREHLKIEPAKDGGPPAEKGDTIYDELQRCLGRPWKAKDHPHIAGWLKANAKPLAVAIEATKRPHYFSPLTPSRTEKGSGGLISALLPAVQKCREITAALTARAMLHLGEGRPNEAWPDLLACHRLGRLVGHGATLIEGLVGIAIDAIASKGDLVLLDNAALDSKTILAHLHELQVLPPMPSIADQIDLGERFMFLDIIMLVDRNGIRALEGLAGGGGGRSSFPNWFADLFLRTIDWDPAMRNANRWYDRMVSASRAKDRATRQKLFKKIDTDLRALKAKATDAVKNPLDILLAKDTSKALGENVGNILISLLVPAIQKVQDASDRSRQTQDNLHLAFALAAYRRDHGRYPDELKALAPKYLAAIPHDMFSGAALVYRPSEKGYLLYSVGVNGVDEHGRSYDDDPRGDDLAVRVPLPAPK